MDSDTKRDLVEREAGDAAPGDNTTRARNRTVMISPEMTGNMRARLGGQASGEVFEPAAVLDDANPGLSTEWETSEPDGASDRMVFEYQDAPEDLVEVRGWESSNSGEVFEPESPRLGGMIPPEVNAEESSAPPQWEEPKPVMLEEPRTIAPARIVRSISSSREDQARADQAEQRSGRVHDSHSEGGDCGQAESPRLRPQAGIFEASEQMASESEIEPFKHERIFWKGSSQLVGFLVTYDFDPLGSYVELRKGRLLITSESEVSGNCLIIDHDTVSPMHAVMRIADGGAVQVLDQLSEYGTRIVRSANGQDAGEELLLSGDKASVRNGDSISFGDRKFYVCLVMAG